MRYAIIIGRNTQNSTGNYSGHYVMRLSHFVEVFDRGFGGLTV